MKAIVILINFALSFIGLTFDISSSSILIPIVGVAWFLLSCSILYRAHKTGTMDTLNELLKINDL